MPDNYVDRGVFIDVTWTVEWTEEGRFLGEDTIQNTERFFLPETSPFELTDRLNGPDRFIYAENETGKGDYINLTHVRKVAVLPVTA